MFFVAAAKLELIISSTASISSQSIISKQRQYHGMFDEAQRQLLTVVPVQGVSSTNGVSWFIMLIQYFLSLSFLPFLLALLVVEW